MSSIDPACLSLNLIFVRFRGALDEMAPSSLSSDVFLYVHCYDRHYYRYLVILAAGKGK
jgi:hypothetical protein